MPLFGAFMGGVSGKKAAEGIVTTSSLSFTISNLNFTAKKIIVIASCTNGQKFLITYVQSLTFDGIGSVQYQLPSTYYGGYSTWNTWSINSTSFTYTSGNGFSSTVTQYNWYAFE